MRNIVSNDPLAFDCYSFSFNNPVRYVDPDGHFAIPLLFAAVTPVGWAAIGVTAVGAAAYFAVPGVQEAVTEGIYQAGEAASNGINTLFAKKSNVQFADYLARKYGLNRAQRRALHDLITRQGLSQEEIEEEAKELARLNDQGKNNANRDEGDEEESENW